MREIVLDTETTGLSPNKGDRVVEIGCVELINHVPTENTFQVYVNPERDMDEGAQKIHGLTNEFLLDKPKFSEIAEEFISYIGESKIIFSSDVISALLVTGVLATFLAFILMLWAQTILSATETGLLLSLEPLFAALYSVFFAHKYWVFMDGLEDL